MRHVIVVEDDPVNARLFRTLLERRCGCRVTLTESADEAVSAAREGADVIIMDVSLRDSTFEGVAMTGVDICRVLKGDPQTACIPVVLATAHAMRGDEESLLKESGADDYVSKPILDLEAFANKIQRWLGQAAA
ncbi:MAG TPA: response regulator [Actinomycetota bacterium]|nr:response regulator [Actinomycetota bacterium]